MSGENTCTSQKLDEYYELIDSLLDTYESEVSQFNVEFDEVFKDLENYIPQYYEVNSKFKQTLIENENIKVMNMKLTEELATQKKLYAEIIKLRNLENNLAMEFVQEDFNATNLYNELTRHKNDTSYSNYVHLELTTNLEQFKIHLKKKCDAEIKKFVLLTRQKYTDIMHFELELNMEINAYQKLLESEEKYNIPNTSVTDSHNA